MRTFRILLIASLLALLAAPIPASEVPSYPQTRRDDTVDTLHGTLVPDPYRWMEVGGPEVEAWARAQSAYTREMLDRLCGVVSPTRRVLSVQDGDYATQYFLRDLPKNAHVVGRLPKNSRSTRCPPPKLRAKPVHRLRKDRAWARPRRWPRSTRAGRRIPKRPVRRFVWSRVSGTVSCPAWSCVWSWCAVWP